MHHDKLRTPKRIHPSRASGRLDTLDRCSRQTDIHERPVPRRDNSLPLALFQSNSALALRAQQKGVTRTQSQWQTRSQERLLGEKHVWYA
jgi:hypothetical protein